jgi:4-deoxy-L-threo-5-hexosulose-uronate ketol-isomerase
MTQPPAQMRSVPDAVRAAHMTTDELREHFLIPNVFRSGEVILHHLDIDRVVLGGATPTTAPLELRGPDSIASSYFAERREIALLNVGGPGSVIVDRQTFACAPRDAMYVGRGSKDVRVESDSATWPSRFYVVSYPAHVAHPTVHITHDRADAMQLGSAEQANRRRLAKYIHPGITPTAQLLMGVTELAEGNVWNTMPAHRHTRRTEVYLYFDLAPDAFVVHLMGEPHETRHLIVRDGDVVLSPPWSIHAGCGTSNYSFCWTMGGENQDFADMQGVDMRVLR